MPTINKLTDNQVRAIRAEDKPKKYADGAGLYLFVPPSGAKLWRYRYRDEASKPQTLTFGAYPLVSLAEARKQRDDARKFVMADEVPPQKRGAPKGQKDITLADAVEQYWPTRKDLSDGYRTKAENCLVQHIVPVLGKRLMREISRTDLMDALKPMDAKGLHVQVRKARLWLSSVWEWTIEHDYATDNPCLQIRPEKAFGRTLTESHAALDLKEVPDFMARMSVEAELQSVLACKLLALTWTRTNELRKMTWAEIDGDLWRIPGERMKRRKDHLVPLSRQALGIIDKMHQRSRGSDYVFPSDRRDDRPMSENAILYLIHRMGYKGKMTGHGMRSVGSTWANEGGYSSDAIERQLAHVPDDKIRAVYNRAEFLPERRAMLQAFADWLMPRT
jgi:integrase